MPTITLYAKAGCHLCDEAREALEAALADRRERAATHSATGQSPVVETGDLALDEVDIRRDPTLFERYRYRIPVIVVDGVERLEGRIAADEIDALVTSLP